MIQLFITIFAPLIILIFNQNKMIRFLSPVVTCYIVGIVLGNLPDYQLDVALANHMAQASVPLAIPILLFSTQIIRWLRLAKTTIISFGLIVVSVLITTLAITLLFKDHLPNYWQLAGMMVGVYTGGTPNMSAIGMAVGVNQEAFVLINAADIVVSAAYLLFILSIGFRLMGMVLPEFKKTGDINQEEIIFTWDKLNYTRRSINGFLVLLISGFCVAIAVLLSKAIFGKDVIAFIMLILTALGVLFSFNDKIRELRGSYEIGQYLLLVFCVAIGSLANIQEITNSSLIYIFYCAGIMFSAVILHMFFCYIFKIDRDTAVITSVAGIFGPPFVAPMASALKNPEVLVSGLTSGLIGYAIGNYLGIAMAYFIKAL